MCLQHWALDSIAAGKRGWQGLAWILERRHGTQFRRTGEIQVAQQFAVGFTEQEWAEIVERAQKGRGWIEAEPENPA